MVINLFKESIQSIKPFTVADCLILYAIELAVLFTGNIILGLFEFALNNDNPPAGKTVHCLFSESLGKLMVLSVGFTIYIPQPSTGIVKFTLGLLRILIDFVSVSIHPFTV